MYVFGIQPAAFMAVKASLRPNQRMMWCDLGSNLSGQTTKIPASLHLQV